MSGSEKLPGRSAVFSLESAIKNGIVLESAQMAHFIWANPLRHQMPRNLETFLLNVTSHTGSHLPLKFVAQVVFADEERVSQQIQRKRFGEIQIDVVDDPRDGLAGLGGSG